MTRNRVSLILLSAALLIASGCGKKESAPTASQPASQPDVTTEKSPPPSSATGATATPVANVPPPVPTSVLATAQYSADPDLRCDLLEAKRVSGGALLIKWRVVNTAVQGQSGLTTSKAKSIYYSFDWNDLYYIDPAENKKYEYLKDVEGNRILEVFWGHLEAGQQRANWAKFPAPPASSTKISISLPKFPPFEDVPISQ